MRYIMGGPGTYTGNLRCIHAQMVKEEGLDKAKFQVRVRVGTVVGWGADLGNSAACDGDEERPVRAACLRQELICFPGFMPKTRLTLMPGSCVLLMQVVIGMLLDTFKELNVPQVRGVARRAVRAVAGCQLLYRF